MSSATITLSLPNSPHHTSLTLTKGTPRTLITALAEAVKRFALTRGVSVLAVEYAVAR